jgi:hypothetical protein
MAKKNDFRKRVLVSEGDLYKLYTEVEQIRREELREQYRLEFRHLLKDAEFVDFAIQPKKERRQA